jgi:hypothetical protein
MSVKNLKSLKVILQMAVGVPGNDYCIKSEVGDKEGRKCTYISMKL